MSTSFAPSLGELVQHKEEIRTHYSTKPRTVTKPSKDQLSCSDFLSIISDALDDLLSLPKTTFAE